MPYKNEKDPPGRRFKAGVIRGDAPMITTQVRDSRAIPPPGWSSMSPWEMTKQRPNSAR
jgi:hypothetical protein